MYQHLCLGFYNAYTGKQYQIFPIVTHFMIVKSKQKNLMDLIVILYIGSPI